ncbi:6-phosphofructo-2-kinase [Polyrhizophydium stewartii]|uniref:6-phosphofructo-2-kinase n=1 Tax=Polyrhizophydium stewartii TaxID=2732419 RepID=A0ABR4N5K8_9FUNG
MDRFRELCAPASIRMDRAAGSVSSISSLGSATSARPRKDICKKLCRYLSWCGFKTKVFNVGNRRRVMTTQDHAADESQPGICPNDPLAPLPSAASSPDKESHPNINEFRNKKLDAISETASSPVGAAHPNIGILPLRTAPQAGLASPVVHPAQGTTLHDANFFDAANADAKAIRERLALDTLEELVTWLKRGGKVAIHDATNSTVERRRSLLERIEREPGIQAFFIESICPDPDVLEKNIQMKLNGPDYKFMDPDDAIRDFKARIANYEKVYQTISEEEENRGVSYIKIINVGKKIIAHAIHGYLPSQCVFYLMQMHIKQRTIWLTRHGESEFNVANRIGGDPPLTPLGARYTAALAAFMKRLKPSRAQAAQEALEAAMASAHLHDSNDAIDGAKSAGTNSPTPSSATGPVFGPQPEPQDGVVELPAGSKAMVDVASPLTIYTSTLRRTMEITDYFDSDEYDVNNVRFLNEIYAGAFEGMTFEEVQRDHADEYASRQRNKLLYRYPGPGGESYIDVIERLRPVIIELERMQSDVLVVTHRVVMRTLIAYFLGIPLTEMPTLNVPLHTLYCLRPQPYGADLSRYTYNPDMDEFEYTGEGL